MKENVDTVQELKNMKSETNETSSIIFKEIDDKNIETDFNRSSDAFRISRTITNMSSINPLRDVHNENKFGHKLSKKKAIVESVVNLKIQYILYKIRDFIRKHQIENNTKFSPKVHKFLRFVRNITLFIY